MNVRGLQLDILHAIVHLQAETASQEVEDTQIAELVELNLSAVQLSLELLAEVGYVQLKRADRLTGPGFAVSLTSEGQKALERSVS